MKFIDILGAIRRGTRFVSGTDNLQADEIKSDDKLAEILRRFSRRITNVEYQVPPEPTEFEVSITSGTSFTLTHGFNCPVRYYITSWVVASGSTYVLGLSVDTANTDSNKLTLKPDNSGRAIIRVEPSQYQPRYTS